VPIAGFW